MGERLQKVIRNGFEAGILANVKIYGPSDKDNTPIVEIPDPDNYGDCKVSNIELVKNDNPVNSNSKFKEYTYEITIDTAVVTDTGGCLIWIKDANNETLSIIDYIYYIEF